MYLEKVGKKYLVSAPLRTPKKYNSLEKVQEAYGFVSFEVFCPECDAVYVTGDPRESLLCDGCNEKKILAIK